MTDGGPRIAIVNWRDPWHPQAGGAERYAWEMARGLTARGAQVMYLTARAPGQARQEHNEGIAIRRLGGRFSVYPLILAWLLTHRRANAVIDCQNGIPFFTPLVLSRRTPVVCVVHHVHTDQFGVHFPPWLARFGRFLEGPVARLVYRGRLTVAVSPSTIAAMRDRLRWPGEIHLVPNGTDPVTAGRPETGRPEAGNSLVWVGRLVKHKRAELLLPLAERLASRNDGMVIDVVGHGPQAQPMTDAVRASGLAGQLRLRGFVPEADKRAVVAGAALHLNTSQGEGWGLCVLEAAALGVPTVAFDVDGLRDSVLDGRTGWLVRDGEELTDVVERALKELSDPARREEIATACREWAAQFDWDRSAGQMAALMRAAGVCGLR
jgi:glycosyltransferase involved in cell wall biosynthesis